MSIPEKIKDLGKRLDVLKSQRDQTQGRIETLKARKDEIEKESKEKFGVSPEELPALISQKVSDLNSALSTIETRVEAAESQSKELGGSK